MSDKADAETRKETDAPSQAPDAGKYSDVKVLADAPAMAMGSIYQTLSHSTGLLFANAVSTQQQNAIISQAATTLGVSFLLGGTNSEQDSMKGKK